jgi:hypothetical protein
VSRSSLPRLKVPPSGSGETVLDLVDNVAGLPPRQATTVHISHDSRCLRIDFHCEDEHPWATIHRHKGPLYEEETVEVFLDPFGDLQCYFEIEVNPINTLLDLMLRRVGKGWRKDLAWQCEGLETSASLTDAGWSATLLIPFAAIAPRAPAPGEVWRANFLRIDRPEGAPRELSAWSPTHLNTFHDCSRFGFLEF